MQTALTAKNPASLALTATLLASTYAQAFAVDPAANAAGATLSNGLELRLGAR